MNIHHLFYWLTAALLVTPVLANAQCEPITLTESLSSPSCNGAADGGISVALTGGNGEFALDWSDGLTGEAPSGLRAGTYQLQVTSCGGASTETFEFELTQPAALVVSATVTDAACTATASGSIELTVSGGTAGPTGYAYDWSDNVAEQGNVELQEGLVADDYSVTVSDMNGCSERLDLTVADAGAPIARATLTQPSGGMDDGAIQIELSFGSDAIPVFDWTGPDGYTNNGQDIADLAVGTYQLYVFDLFNPSCEGTFSYELAVAPPTVVVTTTASCGAAATGTASLAVSGGTAPYTYVWSDRLTATAEQTDLAAAVYSVTVTDAEGRTVDATVTVAALPSVTISSMATSSSGGADGSILLTTSGGGDGGFTYVWSNKSTDQNLTGVTPGDYSVEVLDVATGCTYTHEATVGVSLEAFEVAGSATDLSCNSATGGSCDGTFTLAIAGGVAPYTVTFQNGDAVGLATTYTIEQPGTRVFDNLCPGEVRASVSDAASAAELLGSVTISEPTAIEVRSATVKPLVRAGVASGAIDVAVSGGRPPYTYSWSNGATSQDITNLDEGSYQLTITDDLGCSITTSNYVVERFGVRSVAVTDVTCASDRLGSVLLEVAGAQGPYSYAWSDGSTRRNLTTAPAGEYSVMVTDEASGASFRESYTIVSSSTLAVAAQTTSDFNGVNISCAGAADGVASALASNVQGSVTYTWSDGTLGSELSGLTAGSYGVTARDESGCAVRAVVNLTEPTVLSASIRADNVRCAGEQNGRLMLTAAGGTGDYTYAWDNGATTATLNGLAGGTYTATVTDENGCTGNFTAGVFAPVELSVEANVAPANAISPGSIELLPLGGTAPYSVTWEDSETEQLLRADLTSGSYTATVTDGNGCESITLSLRVPNSDFECFDASDVLTPGRIDGLNDVFSISCITDFADNSVEVFNRWGQRVYSADSYDNAGVSFQGLDANSEPLAAGGYYYVVRYRDANGSQQMLKGALTIVR